LLSGIGYQAMGRPKKEHKFLYISSLNGGAGTYLTTFTTPSKGRGEYKIA
jgi:hypothetical protein